MKSTMNRRRLLGGVACGLLAFGPWMPAQGAPGVLPEPVPGSCKLHQNKVVNPGCVPALSEAVEAAANEYEILLPDLVPTVTQVYVQHQEYTYDEGTQTFTPRKPALYFDTYAQNLGVANVDIQSDDLANTTDPPVSQCVGWTADRVCRERRSVGGFVSHPAHGHIHFEDFADYELRRLDSTGAPDYSDAGLVGVSDKVSFCLVDSAQMDPAAFPVPTYNTCTGAREGITAGWADIYTADLEGQQISVDGLSDGRYALIIGMNTAENLYESDYVNNRVVVTVELSNLTVLPEAAIVDRQWG